MSESTRRKWYGKAYRSKYVKAAQEHKATVNELIVIVGPDKDGRTPDRAVVSRWLQSAGMSKRRGAPPKYSEAYKARYIEAGKRNGSVNIVELMALIGPDENGMMPDQAAVRFWLRGHCEYHGRFSDAYKARLIETARNGGLRFTITQLIEATGPAYGGHFPAQPTVSAWLSEAGVKLISSTWTPEQVEELRRMIEDDGMTAYAARNAFRNRHGKAPSERSLYRWFPDAVGRAEPQAPANVHPIESNEAPGDSWQAAWDAAEGLDGAAWADAVLRAWLPDSSIVASECDVRAVPSGWRRRAA